MLLTMPPLRTGRACSRCGTLYPPHLVESAFRNWNDARRRLMHRSVAVVCRPCEQTARDAQKIRDRWTVKARDVVRRHALRLGIEKRDLIDIYGWDQPRLAHDAEFQYGNGCNYCGHQYTTMSHGLADITLDIVDRSQPPYYRTNTKWCCQTCNRKKGDRGPEFFERDRQVYELWTAAQQMTAEQLGRLF